MPDPAFEPKPAVDYDAVEREIGENPKLADAALAYIQAPYTETIPWAKTYLCTVLGHPEKYPEGTKPSFSKGGCPCGKRKGTETMKEHL